MRNILYIFLLVVATSGSICAQDYCFSQYYLDKLSISPAYVSVGDYSELGMVARNMWPGISDGYKVYMAEYQQKLPKIHSGLGAKISGNLKGGGAYTSTSISILYGYEVNLSDNLKLSLGIEGEYSSRKLHQQNLVYYSMLEGGQSLSDIISSDNFNDLYFNTGAVLYSKTMVMALGWGRFGNLRMSQQNDPNIELYNPQTINVLCNYKIVLDGNPERERMFVVPSVYYQHSNFCEVIMPGVYFSGMKLLLSLAYRLNISQLQNSGAAIVSVGYDFGQFEIGVGHDFDTSPRELKAGGATEVGLKYKFGFCEKK